MSEINIHKISIAHVKDVVLKIFNTSEECIKYADKNRNGRIKNFLKKEEISCDSLHAFLHTVRIEGYKEGLRDGKRWNW